MAGKARLVADALAKVPPLLPLPDDEDMRVTFEVFVSFLRMVAVEDPPSLPFGVGKLCPPPKRLARISTA